MKCLEDRLAKKVLVLNQSYSPLNVCTVRKAFLLVLSGKAYVISEHPYKKIRSASKVFSLPNVIRLSHYVYVPYKRIVVSRKNILWRDQNQCQYCGSKRKPLTIDHLIPKARGGASTWENLVTACMACNGKKGNKTLEEAGMKMKVQPKQPSYIFFIKQQSPEVEKSWKPYLFMN